MTGRETDVIVIPAVPRDRATVERAARAICDTWGYVWDAPRDDPQAPGDDANFCDERPSKRLYRQAARAALTAASRPDS